MGAKKIVKNVFKNVTNADKLWKTVKNCENLLKKCFNKLDGYFFIFFYLNIEKVERKKLKICEHCEKM